MREMKVLLLGATGLLGHNVLAMLQDRGIRTVALTRRADGIRLPRGDWEVVEGSPLDHATLSRAAEGCQAIINCAGTADMSLRRLEDYTPVNRDLPALIVRVMEEKGIDRLVHVSTVNTIGYGTPDSPADESAPMQSPFRESLYAESKRQGEEVVADAARRHPDWHAVVICPGYIIGAFDVKPSSGRMLLAAYGLRLAAAPGGGKAFVAARDVAEAAVNAIGMGENGRRYIVANSHGCLAVSELFGLQARVEGYRQRVLRLPGWLVLAAGKVGDGLRRLGVATALSSANVRQLLVREYYDNSLGLCDLRYSETPIGQAIAEFHQWRRENTSAK